MGKVIEVKKTDGTASHIILNAVSDALDRVLSGKKRVIVITDSNLLSYYENIISKYQYIVIPQGEENKTLGTVEYIYSKLLEFGADRHTYLVGFGGGIVTDITGFAASTYQRGLGFGFVATSLLSQVDASVGGKNGVNFHSFKNMIGVFNQPDFVICDSELLNTLPEREFRAGLAEVIKSGVIKSSELFELFENNSYEQIKNDKNILKTIIETAIKIKAAVVEEDERESGERKKLNFGHTLAHAIEKNSREFNHGEAVAIGMVMAVDIACGAGFLGDDNAERIKSVISKMGFVADSGLKLDLLFETLKSDKKRELNSIDFIMATTIGKAKIVNIEFSDLKQLLKA